MIFVFLDDQTLDIIEDFAEERGAYEGVDVEEGIYGFFDSEGNPLVPHFTVPNKKGKLLGLIPWVKSGRYELVKASPSAQPKSLQESWKRCAGLNPNRHFTTLEEVHDYLRGKGAIAN